jgi:hypothetical protein
MLRQRFTSTMPFMSRTVRHAAALVGLTVITAASAQDERAAFAKFKSEMMPKVGQKITVVGTLDEGKQGFWLAFNHWGAHIYTANESGSAKQNDLYAHIGQTVKITGILRHFEPVGTGKTSTVEPCKSRRSISSSMPPRWRYPPITKRLRSWGRSQEPFQGRWINSRDGQT